MSSSEIRVTVSCDTSQLTTGLNSATQSISGLNRTTATNANSMSSAWTSVGKSVTGAGVSMTMAGNSIQQVCKPIAGILTESVKKSIDFNDAFAGVRKTVTATEPEFKKLEQGIRDMAKEMPETTEQIAGVMEVAGQLGVKGTDNLLAFTKTAVMLGDTTNMSSEEASTALARFMNITGTSTDKVSNLGSTLVELGNNTATTESEIMTMSLRLAAAGSQVGMTDDKILGFAATLSSLGINAEAGGTAFSKLMINMQLATEKGGESLDNFAQVANMSADEFARAFKEDASSAILAFVSGLNDTERNGKSAIAVLDDMGIKEVRLRDSILKLCNANEEAAKNQEMANKAYEDNLALQTEADKRYETTRSQIDIMKNTLADIGITLGSRLLPAINSAIKWFDGLLNKINALNPNILTAVGVIGALGVAFGAILSTLGMVVMGIGGVITAFGAISGAVSAVMGVLMGPVGLIIAAVVAVGAALKYCWDEVDGFKEHMIDAFNRVKTVVVEAVQMVWDIIKGVWGAIKPFVMSVFTGASEIIGEAFSLIVDIIVPQLERTWTIIKTIWGLIGPFLVDTLGNACTILKGVWEALVGVVKGVIQILHGILTGDWGKVCEGFSTIGQGIVDGAKGIWNGFKDELILIWDTIAGWCESIWNKIKDFVMVPIEATKEKASEVWNSIKDCIQTVHEAIQPIIDAAWKVIQNVIDNVCTVVGAVVDATWGNILRISKACFDAVWSKIKEVWEKVKDKITSVVEAVKSKVEPYWNAIKNVTTSVYDAIKTKITSIMDTIKGKVETVVNTVKNKVESVWNTIKNTTSSVWNGIKDAIVNPIESAKNTITGIIDRIKNAFSNLKIKIPDFKLPHVKVTMEEKFGGLVKVPNFDIKWYAKGGFFNKASMIGVGEAGKEAVLPLENKRNMKPYATAVASLMNDMRESNEQGCVINMNLSDIVIRDDRDISKLAEQLQKYIDRERRRKGVLRGV